MQNRGDAVAATFLYIHVGLGRRHYLRLHDGCDDDRLSQCVRLMSGLECTRGDSRWHGRHDWTVDSLTWRMSLHYVGDDAEFLRCLEMRRDFSITFGDRGAQQVSIIGYWGMHANRRWCYVVYLGQMSSIIVREMLGRSRVEQQMLGRCSGTEPQLSLDWYQRVLEARHAAEMRLSI